MFDLSVIICSHNPRTDYLRRTLNALQEQDLSLGNWELLLVDNASDHALATSWDISWHPYSRYIAEPELGVSAARRRGIREAVSDLLIFVDDDNVLDKTYLTRAFNVKEKWPMLGAWGSGSTIPEYELEPDVSVDMLLKYLAIRETEKTRWSNIFPCVEATPWGAGMCVRANVADAYRRIYDESTILISSRRGAELYSGEDVEMAYVACHLGLGMAVFPELKLIHLIPKERVSPNYLLKLYEGTSTSDALLAHKWLGHIPEALFRPRRLLGLLKNFVVRRGVDRRMYFAKVRALRAARRTILSSRAEGGDSR